MDDKEYQKKVNEWFIVMIIVMLVVATIVFLGIEKTLIQEQNCNRLAQTCDIDN